MKKLLKVIANINILIGALLMVLPIGALIYINLPSQNPVLADFEPQKEDKILTTSIFNPNSTLTNSAVKYTFKDPFANTIVREEPVKEVPLAFTVTDGVTTTGASIQINTLPLNTTIFESYNMEAGLGSGVWRDPKYGTPDNNSQPIVLAAHRWGENSYSWDYRNKNLFTQFDQLKGGAIVTITWNGKVYQYQIDGIETTDHVSRTADLIMYTCIDYYSSQRIIVYANRLK